MTGTTRDVQIVAHRGAMDEAPENTASAFEAALSHRIDGIELDVQLTADGIPVIYHDHTLSKITGKSQTVAEVSYERLASFDWGGWYGDRFRGEPLLTLETCLGRFLRRTRLLIELKSFPHDQATGRSTVLARAVLHQLENAVDSVDDDRIRILSFDPDVLSVAGGSGRWKCVQNLADVAVITKINHPPAYIDAYCAAIDGIDPGTVDACHALGRRFMTWSCNRPGEAEKAITCGCDVIMTDRPGWMVNYLDTRNRR